MENINNLFINMDGSDDLLEYNPVQAKFCASLLWFVCRVSEHGGSEIPSEITSPIKITMTNALVVRPAVSDYLCSGQIYLTVGKVIFKQDIKTLWELIQNMSHKGVYVLDENEEAVTDLDLMEKFPFKMFSHLALMDSLMLLYSSSRVSVQNVINVVRKFSNFNASKELPFDLEDALLLWINKINQANMVDHRKHKPTTNEIVRVRKDKIVEMKIFPVVNELIDIVKDCKSLLSVLLYYLPQYIHFEDIKLSSLSSTDEFIQNIELFRSICAENICTSVFALRVEDFLYASEHLKSNFLTLLCEMFFELEVDSLKRQNVIYNIEKKIQKQISPVDTHDDSVKLLSESSSNQSNPPRSKASQPLLSKRSKQQFAKFETEHSQDLEKTKPTLPQAWVHSNEETVNKKAKISLDFRPSSGSSVRSSTVSNSASSVGHDPEQRNDESKAVPPHPRASWTDNAFYPTLPNDKQQLQQQHRHYRDDQHNQRSPMTSSSQDGASTNASFEDQLKKISMPGTFSCIERENIKPHTRESTSDSNLVLQGSHNINSDNQFVSRSRNLSYNDGIDLVHNASMQNHSCSFSLAAQEKTSPDLMHNSIAQQQQNTRHVTAGEPKKSPSHSANPYIITHTALDRNHTMTDYEDGDDDDALSTITEGTEPDAPSLYSFHSSSSTSTKYNSESDDNFSVAGRDVGGFFIDDNHVDIMKNHIHRVKTPADFIRSASTDESQDNNNRTLTNDNLVGVDGNKDDDIFEKSPTLFVRSSYTVGRGTVESALATGIPIITDSVKRSCNQLVPDSKQFQYFDVESSQNISAKESDDGRQNCLEQSTYGGSVNDSSLIPERTLQISPLDQPCDNDFEDAPFDTVNHPTSNSQSIESRSSSSGISADDGRFLSASDGEYKRPGVTLYSSLSEYTNSSPDNHFKAVAGNHGNNLKHNRSDANKEDYFKEHVSNDLTNENSDERTTKNSSEFGTGSRSLHNSSNYSPVLVKQKSVFEKKEIFNVNKALMDIGHGKDVTDCDKIITIDTKLSKSPKDAKSSERRDSLEQSESSQENSPISLYGKCNLYKNTKEKSDKLILTENSVLSNTLNKMKLFTTGNLAPSFNHWPFKKVEKKENKRKDTKEDSSGKITWCDVNPNKRKIKPTEAEEKLKQLRDSYKKSEANVAKWTDFVKEKCLHAILKINSQRIQFHKMQSSNVFTLGDVADILDSALDTGISIVDALAKLSELADQGKVDRQKCYNKLKLEDTYQTIHVSNKVTYYPPCFGNADNDNESVRQLHDTVYEDTHANSQKQSHAQVDVSSDDRNNNSVVMRSRTKKPAAGKRSTYVLDSSPIKSAKEAAMQGIPIIQALGDLCSVTDNFLKDYDDEVENNSPENNDDAPSRHVILENEINSKVNEILYSFQQLDSTVDMLTKDALNNANYEYREYDADSIISARFSTAQNEDSCFSEDNLPNYATQYSSDLISVNAQPVKHVLTKGDSLTSTNDQPPRASSNEDADMSSAVIRRHKTRSSRPKTCIITEKPMFSSEHDFRLTQTLEATSVVSDHKLDTVDSINQSKLLTNSRRLNLSDCTLGNDIENKSTRDFDFKRHEPPVERRSAKKYTSNWNRGTFVISSSVHCTDAEVTLCEHVGKVEKLSDNDSRDSESTLDESEGDAETDVQNQNLKNVSSNRGVFLSKERAGSHLSLRKPQVDSHTNASCPTLYPNPVRQFSTESILSLPRQLGSNLFENCLSFTDELSNVSPACSQEDTNLSLERSSSMTDLSSAHTYENELHQQKYSLISQSLLDFKKTASMSNHVSNSLADRTQSQPLLSDDKDTSRKTSVGNVINKLGMLHKVMFTSLSKLTELHAVKREVYLSQSSVDTINNDDDSDIPIQQTRFSLSGSVGNHLGGKSIFADDHQNIGYYHRSISAPNAGDEVYKNMIRQYSNSSGETYTLISPPNDIVEKDSSLVLIDFNESDNEESSERVFIHSFAGEEDWIEDSPRSYHFETDFMTPAEVSDDTGAELMNVKGIIQSLEQEWSDKISTKYIKDEETLRDSHQTASDHVTISQGPKTVDNRFLNQTYYPSDTSHHFYSSNSLYSEVSNDRISAGNESEEPAENAFVTGIQTVTLRDRSGLTPKPRVATYVLETSKTQVAGIPSRDESQPFNDTKHVDKNLSLQKSLEVKPFLRERKPTSTKTARFGTYVLDKHEFTAQPYVIDIALDDSDVISVDTANNSGSQSDIIQPFNYSPSLVCTNEKSKEGRHLVEKKKPKNVTKTSSIINQNSWAIPTAGNTSNQNKSSSAPSTPVHKTQNTSSSNSSLSKSRCSRPLLGKKSSTFTAGESSMRGRDENNQKDVIGRKTNFLKTKSSVKTSPNRNNKLRSKSESKNDGVENHIEKPTKTRLTLDERQTKDTPSNRKNKDTPSNRKNRDTPLNRKNKDTSSYPKNKDTPSDRKNKDTPSNRKNKDTPSNRKPFLKRTSTSYTDKLSDKKDPPKSKKNQEIGEPLTERLASLRVQLEQKRLKFEEEKKRQQELWNQQRAKILQDAFFVMINGKENEDPSHLPESIDVATTPSAKQNASRELQLDANRDRKCKTEGEERSTKSKRESPREFVQRKREEKQKEMQSVEQQNLWFVGFDEEAKNDNSKAKNEKIKNEKLSNSANMINVNKENRGIFEKVTKLNNIDDLGEHMECELANDTVSFESERIQGEEKTNTYSLMGMANSTPPQTTELNDTSLLIKQIPTKEHIEPKIESECQTEQISKLTQISQANDDTVSQGISKPLSQLKALNSNTSKIIAKSAEMSNKIEIKIRKSESENNDLIGVKLLNTGIHPVKSYAYDEDISGDISGIVPSNSLKTEQDKETDEDKNLTARKSLSDTSNALFEEKDKWEQVIAEQATVTDNYQVSGQTTTPTDLLQSGVFTGYSTIQNPIGETFLVVDNPSIAKHQVNNYVTETKNTTDSTGFVKRFQHFSVNEETDPSYLTSTPMKRQDIESRTPQARTQENGIKVDNVFADQQPSEHSIGESDTSTTPKAKAWGVSFGDDFVGADTGLTPDQERKRSRFLKSRMKKMEESRKKKEEENEKQRLKEEELALEKEKLEDEEKLRRERLMEEKLAEATRQLQEVDFSKRLHGLTYNMDPQPTSERRKEQRQLQSPSQRNNIRAISPTSMRTVSPLEPEETNVYAEYKGPSAYQKPSGKSNRKIIQNAIMHCCLCGEVNKEAKEKCLETVSQSDASHFLVLFREGLKFKSVYEYRPETETVTRIYGIGPKTITSKMHSSYFKYNSGGKHFNALETKHLSIQVDGVMIKKELWEKKPTSSKPNSNPRKKPPMTLKPAR